MHVTLYGVHFLFMHRGLKCLVIWFANSSEYLRLSIKASLGYTFVLALGKPPCLSLFILVSVIFKEVVSHAYGLDV